MRVTNNMILDLRRKVLQLKDDTKRRIAAIEDTLDLYSNIVPEFVTATLPDTSIGVDFESLIESQHDVDHE